MNTFQVFLNFVIILLLIREWYFGKGFIQAFKRFERSQRPRHVEIYLTFEGIRIDMDNVKVSKQYNIALEEADEFGNPVAGAPDAAPAISVTDSTLATIGVAADGVTPVIVPTGKLGSCQLQVSGMLGGKPFLAVDDLVFVAGDAVSIQLKLSEGADNIVPPPAG